MVGNTLPDVVIRLSLCVSKPKTHMSTTTFRSRSLYLFNSTVGGHKSHWIDTVYKTCRPRRSLKHPDRSITLCVGNQLFGF